jgi:predicted anti-sigma-YlaC factor YlaD
MSEIHLRETELACASCDEADAPSGARVAEHLRWCAQCRSTAAEHRWLGERIEDTLAVMADAVDVPRPRWRVVKRRMMAGQKRRIAGWRASATASIALAMCAILSLSSILGATVAAQTLFPEAVMTPASVTVIIPDAYATSGATPTPGASREDTESPYSLTLPPLPTPPEPDA